MLDVTALELQYSKEVLSERRNSLHWNCRDHRGCIDFCFMVCHSGQLFAAFPLKTFNSEICCIVLSLETALELQKADFFVLAPVVSLLLYIEPGQWHPIVSIVRGYSYKAIRFKSIVSSTSTVFRLHLNCRSVESPKFRLWSGLV